MSDLISRQAAIDELNDGAELLRRVLDDADIVGAERAKYEWGLGLIESYISDMEELPSAQPEQRWIPVSERLPEKYIGQWLCCTSDGAVMILPYDTPGDGTKECVFYKWDDDGYFYQTFDVVAWMPLPKPWRGETNE